MREWNASLEDQKWGCRQQEEVAWDWQRMDGVVKECECIPDDTQELGSSGPYALHLCLSDSSLPSDRLIQLLRTERGQGTESLIAARKPEPSTKLPQKSHVGARQHLGQLSVTAGTLNKSEPSFLHPSYK